MSAGQATHLEAQVTIFFESLNALVTDYEPLIPTLTNDEKDRHVLAYSQRRHEQNMKILDDMAALAQELGIYD